MIRLAAPLLMLLALLLGTPARADTQDIAAAARSVVRVALVATRGSDGAYFVGHGSGIVIAPDKILTNAHVVELVREEPNIVIGVIPAEGKKSYGAKIIAFSPHNDLALLQISGGTLPVATFFAASTQDGQSVTAIGYPGNVDRAQGMGLADIIQPMTPVKTSGTISTGRSSKEYDTVLHTAPMAAGNSGGPLVDTCGRVLGVNSFGSLSDGNDAEYGFAVSNREVASFLRQAGVQPLRTTAPCRSLSDLEAAEKNATEQAKLEADARAADATNRQRERTIRARQDAEQSIIAARENFIAVAVVLLSLALVCGGVAGIASIKDNGRRVRIFGIAGGVLFVGALAAFFLRPSFNEVDDRAAAIAKDMAVHDGSGGNEGTTLVSADKMVGDNLCRIDLDRSRVTVSETPDVNLNWQSSGCINGRTQLSQNGGTWSRIFVPDGSAEASIRTVDPMTGSYRSDRYSLDVDTAEQARKARADLHFEGCTTDAAKLEELARLEANIRALLPAQPNERLVYHCAPARR